MSPEERALYSITLYLIGDEVEIAGTGIVGEVTGIQIEVGAEDKYRVFYYDAAGNPQERYWRAGLLDPVDDDPENNVVAFPGRNAPTSAERTRAIAEARRNTKH